MKQAEKNSSTCHYRLHVLHLKEVICIMENTHMQTYIIVNIYYVPNIAESIGGQNFGTFAMKGI